MSDPRPGRPPTRALAGSLAKTPIPRLLVSASNARVTGTLELRAPEESVTLVLTGGAVTKVKTSAPVAYLGSVVYELGYIESEELNSSLRELARTKWLHGEILLARSVISSTQLDEALREQTTRKLVHLFSLPAVTEYQFEADVDRLGSYGGAGAPRVDPIAAVWRGVRDGLALAEVDGALARAKLVAFRVSAVPDPHRALLAEPELALIEALCRESMTEDDLVAACGLDRARVRALLYFLLITRSAEPDRTRAREASRPPRQTLPAAQRPTVPEMGAVSASTRASIGTLGSAETARWRAVARITSSARIPVASPQASESGTMPVERGRTPTTAPPRLTLGGVSGSSSPPARRGLTPAQEWLVSDYAKRDPPAASRIPVAPRIGSMDPPRSLTPPGSRRSSTPVPAVPRRSLTPRSSRNAVSAKAAAGLAARRRMIAERARAIQSEDLFQRLGLPRDATSEEVDLAFHSSRAIWDPALLPPGLEEARHDAAAVMACLEEAHRTLSDLQQRSEYAARLARAGPRR